VISLKPSRPRVSREAPPRSASRASHTARGSIGHSVRGVPRHRLHFAGQGVPRSGWGPLGRHCSALCSPAVAPAARGRCGASTTRPDAPVHRARRGWAHLDEANVLGVLPEALAAQVQLVLAHDALVVAAHTAGEQRREGVRRRSAVARPGGWGGRRQRYTQPCPPPPPRRERTHQSRPPLLWSLGWLFHTAAKPMVKGPSHGGVRKGTHDVSRAVQGYTLALRCIQSPEHCCIHA
jgi:hypothetical protein